jgi:hypothetical protein
MHSKGAQSPPTLFPFSKRWRERTERWVAPDTRFCPSEYAVDVLREREAKAFTVAHHYSGTFPAARLSVGLFRCAGTVRQLVGSAIFSVGIQPRSIPSYTGLETSHGVELGRFCLLNEVGFNGESFFLARALRIARQLLGIDVVLSYCDPLERRDPVTAMLTKPAHRGVIYQASNALYAGRARPNSLVVTASGAMVSRRALGKIALGEVGRGYATEQLRVAGVPDLRPREDPRAWLQRLYDEGALRRVRHPGNFVYVFSLHDAAKRSVLAHNNGGLPYPKKVA